MDVMERFGSSALIDDEVEDTFYDLNDPDSDEFAKSLHLQVIELETQRNKLQQELSELGYLGVVFEVHPALQKKIEIHAFTCLFILLSISTCSIRSLWIFLSTIRCIALSISFLFFSVLFCLFVTISVSLWVCLILIIYFF